MQRYKQIPDFVKSYPEVDLPFAGARGWMISGPTQQVVFIEFDETVPVPEHSHDEQWEFVLTGRVELSVDGTTELHEAGDNFFIPKDHPHSANVQAGYKAMIIFNSPDRYKPKSGVDAG